MQTKLVYVLTCAPEATYIEQALISIWSARYHNPEAHIVLLVDDKTDQLLIGKRAEVLEYITEKVVIPFEDANATMMYRSRWIKTQVRQLVKGDFLFIDCDTIVMCDLSHIEHVDADIAMGRDENIDLDNEDSLAIKSIIDNCKILDVDIVKEKYYFNSGVMYVKDTIVTHKLYELWHEFWKNGVSIGLSIDQPAFAKANINMHHPVVLLEDRWNCIIPTQIEEIYSAYILHFWHSVSFLYSQKVMNYIHQNGLTDFAKYYILHPTETFLPSDNHVYHYKLKDYIRFYRLLERTLKSYANHIDKSFTDFILHMRGSSIIANCLRAKLYRIASLLIVFAKMYRVKLSPKYVHYTNFYAKK